MFNANGCTSPHNSEQIISALNKQSQTFCSSSEFRELYQIFKKHENDEDDLLDNLYKSIIDILKQITTKQLTLDIAFIKILNIIDYENYSSNESIYNIVKESTNFVPNLHLLYYFPIFSVFGSNASKLSFGLKNVPGDYQNNTALQYFCETFLSREIQNTNVTFTYCNSVSTSIFDGVEQYIFNNISSHIEIKKNIANIIANYTCFTFSEYIVAINKFLKNFLQKNEYNQLHYNRIRVLSPLTMVFCTKSFKFTTRNALNDSLFLSTLYFAHEMEINHFLSTSQQCAYFFAKSSVFKFWSHTFECFDLIQHNFNIFYKLLTDSQNPLSIFFNGNNEWNMTSTKRRLIAAVANNKKKCPWEGYNISVISKCIRKYIMMDDMNYKILSIMLFQTRNSLSLFIDIDVAIDHDNNQNLTADEQNVEIIQDLFDLLMSLVTNSNSLTKRTQIKTSSSVWQSFLLKLRLYDRTKFDILLFVLNGFRIELINRFVDVTYVDKYVSLSQIEE